MASKLSATFTEAKLAPSRSLTHAAASERGVMRERYRQTSA